MPNSEVAALMERLRPSLGERISDAAGLRAQFGRSEAGAASSLPAHAFGFGARECRIALSSSYSLCMFASASICSGGT